MNRNARTMKVFVPFTIHGAVLAVFLLGKGLFPSKDSPPDDASAVPSPVPTLAKRSPDVICSMIRLLSRSLNKLYNAFIGRSEMPLAMLANVTLIHCQPQQKCPIGFIATQISAIHDRGNNDIAGYQSYRGSSEWYLGPFYPHQSSRHLFRFDRESTTDQHTQEQNHT